MKGGKFYPKLLFLLLCSFFLSENVAFAAITWNLTGSTLTISGSGDMPNYSSNGVPWYSSKGSIKAVVVDSGVTSVGDYAFRGCFSLEVATMPRSLTYICSYGFAGCSSLKAINFLSPTPPTVGYNIFENVSSRFTVVVPYSAVEAYKAAWPKYSAEVAGGDYLQVKVNDSRLGSATGSGQHKHGDAVSLTATPAEGSFFVNWTAGAAGTVVGTDNPLSVTLTSDMVITANFAARDIADAGTTGRLHWELRGSGDNLVLHIYGSGDMPDYESVDSPWYNSRSSIKAAVVDSGVTSIGCAAFSFCYSLMSVSLPGSVAKIGSAAFVSCYALTSLTIPGSVAKIGNTAFGRCYSLMSVTIPNLVAEIEYSTFDECTSLASLAIPSSVVSIGSAAFGGCTSLESILADAGSNSYASEDGILFNKRKTELVCYPAGKRSGSYAIPESVDRIGIYSFFGCSFLDTVTIPNSVATIGDGAFWSCSSLRYVTIPNSVVTIGNNVFYGCTSLKSATFPNTLTSIGRGVFFCCSSLRSVNIPSSVTSIERDAFYSCFSLKSVDILNTVTSIEEDAFHSCTSLDSVIIPSSVASIGYHAFYSCTSLESLTSLSLTPPSLDSRTFDNVSSSFTVTVPTSAVSAYKAHSQWGRYTIAGGGLLLDVKTNDSRLGSVTGDGLYEYGDVVSLLATPAEGSVFVNWTAGTAGAVTGTANPLSVTVTGDMVITANFAPAYTLSFDAQSGEVTPTSKIVMQGYNAAGELPTPTRSGYAFDGWYTGLNGAGMQYTATTIVTASVTLYANWLLLISVVDAEIAEKIYDKTAAATVSSVSFMDGDNAPVILLIDDDYIATAVYANSNAGSSAVALTVRLAGIARERCVLPNGKDTIAVALASARYAIQQRPITLTIPPAAYGAAPAVDLAAGSELAAGDGSFTGALSIAGSTSQSGNLAAGEHRFSQGTLAVADGNSGSNYKITFESMTFSVLPLALEHNIAASPFKVYDGTAAAGYTGGLIGVADGDEVSLAENFALRYANSRKGKGIAVTAAGWALQGADKSCYTLPDFAPQQADIIARPLTVSGTVVDMVKVYNGTNTARVTSAGKLGNVAAGDNAKVSIAATALYSDSAAGTGKTIKVFYTLSGIAAGSYAAPDTLTLGGGIINPRPLKAHSTIVKVKPYDGTNAAVATVDSVLNVVAGDSVSVNVSAAYGSPLVGKGKAITARYKISGRDASSYIPPADTVAYGGEISAPSYSNPDSPDTSGCFLSGGALGGGCDDNGDGIPNPNDPSSPDSAYYKPCGGGDTCYCGDGVLNVNCPDYPGYLYPGGGGADADGDGIPNINDPDSPDSSYYKPGGGGDTSYCGGDVLNIDCPSYPGYDQPGGGGSSSSGGSGGSGSGDTSYCGNGVPNANCPSYPGYTEPGGGGADDDGDGIPNINDPDAPNYYQPGGGGDTSSCGSGVVNVNCPGYPGYKEPGGGGADDDNDGMLNINDPNAPNYHLPGGGGDTNYCGGGVLNIFCPDYPEKINDTKETLVDTLPDHTYGDMPFKLDVPDGEEFTWWISYNQSVAEVDADGSVHIKGVGLVYFLRYPPVDMGSAVRLNVLPKPLKIEDTWVNATKVFDGTCDAGATEGSLVGIEPPDEGLVSVKATAAYSSSAVGRGKPITVSYALSGSRSYCYVAPPNETVLGSIVKEDDASVGYNLIVAVYKQLEGEKGVTHNAPWAGAKIRYTVDSAKGKELEQQTNSAGKYIISHLRQGDTVQVEALPMHGYLTPPAQKVVVTKSVEEIPAFIYKPDAISMVTLAFADEAGNSLGSLEREAIGDTVYYTAPCGRSGAGMELHIRYTVPVGVYGFPVDVHGVGNGGYAGDIVAVAPDDTRHLTVDMSRRGRRCMFGIRLYSATGAVKQYTLVLERKFELFDVINEHIGHLRVVNNNPDINGCGLKFGACEWYCKRDAGEWQPSSSRQLYFTAGTSIHDKFTARDSMWVALTTVDGRVFATCPDANNLTDSGKDDSGDETGSSRKSVSVSVYPNPVAAGGLIRLKQAELIGDEDELYTKFYLLDAQGRPVSTGNASDLLSGLTMPEIPGVYHLVFEGKADRKAVKVAVGQRK
ncbi:MAG: leucine-rich repeat protein [Prevotellaceae bacterium]|nr:leucine-rich repeat protein [Prevotellaceae bacterium]